MIMSYQKVPYRKAEGLILNSRYKKTQIVAISEEIADFNMHELAVSSTQHSALYSTKKMVFDNHSTLGLLCETLFLNRDTETGDD